METSGASSLESSRSEPPLEEPGSKKKKKRTKKSETCGIFILRPVKNTNVDTSENRDKFDGSKWEVLTVHATHSSWKHWGVPKGLPEPGETWAGAACRELQEETGLIVTEEKLAYVASVDYPKRPKILHAFYVFWDEIEKKLDKTEMKCTSLVTGDRHYPEPFPEVDAFRWLTWLEAKAIVHGAQRQILDLLENII